MTENRGYSCVCVCVCVILLPHVFTDHTHTNTPPIHAHWFSMNRRHSVFNTFRFGNLSQRVCSYVYLSFHSLKDTHTHTHSHPFLCLSLLISYSLSNFIFPSYHAPLLKISPVFLQSLMVAVLPGRCCVCV